MTDPMQLARECGFGVTLRNSIDGDELCCPHCTHVLHDGVLELIARVRAEAMEEFCARIRPLMPIGDIGLEYATGHAHAIYEAENAIRAMMQEQEK